MGPPGGYLSKTGSDHTHKYWTPLKWLARTNALAHLAISSVMKETSFITLISGACIINLITAVVYGFRNKLQCLSLARFSSLV